MWDTTVLQAISGKETRIARQTYPRWKWELTYNLLRSNASYNELQQLAGFFNNRQGMYDTFLYADADDNNVSGQTVSTGDGVTTSFQLIRTFGSFIEPVLAPNVISHVYLNGVTQSSSNYSLALWGTTAPGVLTFNAPPGSGVAITADFSYYFPVRMSDDSVSFTMFLSQYYKTKNFSSAA